MNALRLTVGVEGWFEIWAESPSTGIRRLVAPYQKNAVLDNGRNNMAVQNNWMQYCQIGTGSTPPTPSDSSLTGYVTYTDTIQADLNGQQAAAPYYGWRRVTYRFPAGLISNENLNEIGVGWGQSGSTLATRALIRDEVGDPTTVTPIGDEFLDVVYEIRYYPPLGDNVQTDVVLEGINYTCTSRAANVTQDRWSADIGTKFGNYSPNVSSFRAFDGVIGAITSSPTGNAANCDNANQYDLAYQTDTFFVGVVCNTGTQGWNLGAGIRSLLMQTTMGEYQTEFEATAGGATVPKTDLKTINITWNIGFVEEVIP